LELRRPVNQGAVFRGFVNHPHDVTPLLGRRHGFHIVAAEDIQQLMDAV
jgi:hypothetical protein